MHILILIVVLVVVIKMLSGFFTALGNVSWVFLVSASVVGIVCFFGYVISLKKMTAEEKKREIEEFDRKRQEQIAEDVRLAKEKDELENAFVELYVEAVFLLLSEHLGVLFRKQKQSLYIDDYGKTQGFDRWLKEIDYFRKNIIDCSQSLLDLRGEAARLDVDVISETNLEWLARVIDEQLENYTEEIQ
jgi:hypothetical protein